MSVLKMLPSAYGLGQYFQDLDHSFSPYGPPSRQITYMYTNTQNNRLNTIAVKTSHILPILKRFPR